MAFEEIQTTGEYMETHYFKQRNFATSAALISVNAFWHDYAQYLLNRGEEGAAKHFLSANFTKNADNQVSAILTFALLDLPLTDAPSHQTKGNDGRGLELKAAGNIIIFRKEVREAPFEVTNDIIVTHRYIPSTEASENQSSAIPDEFLVNKAYSCEVIMTNVSPKQSTFSLLYQIPQGSLPLQQTKYMKSLQQTLSPYTTQKLIFHFYFPKSGEFTHFPSNVAAGEKIIARATGLEGRSLKVVRKLSVAKKETFLDIMQSDNREEDVIEFIKTHNLLKGEKGFSFHQMLWMLKDKEFFKKVLEVLRGRMIYDNQVWSYALHHKLVDDERALREYFQNAQPWNMVQYLGSSFSSKLFTRTLADAEFKALDYFPMVNARAHQVGDLEHWTLNRTFKDTYHSFLRIMVQHASAMRATSGVDDPMYKLLWVQYLQLQDRTDEAIKMFEEALPGLLKIAESDGSVRIQVDYMRAYFDFFTGLDSGFKVARSIVRDYENYPVPQWRIPFLEILDQLNEYDGEMIEDDEVPDKDLESMTEEQKKQKYKQSIKKEPRLACELNEQKLEIEAANIKQVQVKFYIIDAEILFSRTPFLKTNTEEFSYVKPCHKLDLDLSTLASSSGIEKSSLVDESVSSVGEVAIGQVQKVEVKIPEHLALQNMVIEIGGEGKQLFKTYYATQIKVVMTEAYGELKVLEKGDSAKPLPRVYVKVFAQKKGQSTDSAFFFKDGYTDIRGKFDYAQTSGNRLKDVQKFAILVMSDTLGSIIKECDPPKGDFSGASAAESGVSGGADKAERIINRVNKWNAQKTSAKCK
ncbi:hypothetical protein FGO68_gene14226 [Halteria grandinella]|uniref:Uncharacterized protein n=1 Tax=Halteria grandinella TaxID=5974 RepID=A0A8J8NHI6_HALGN|nr:hypothetical protein FGO68_gene14226 [Halteria grandinella]